MLIFSHLGGCWQHQISGNAYFLSYFPSEILSKTAKMVALVGISPNLKGFHKMCPNVFSFQLRFSRPMAQNFRFRILSSLLRIKTAFLSAILERFELSMSERLQVLFGSVAELFVQLYDVGVFERLHFTFKVNYTGWSLSNILEESFF